MATTTASATTSVGTTQDHQSLERGTVVRFDRLGNGFVQLATGKQIIFYSRDERLVEVNGHGSRLQGEPKRPTNWFEYGKTEIVFARGLRQEIVVWALAECYDGALECHQQRFLEAAKQFQIPLFEDGSVVEFEIGFVTDLDSNGGKVQTQGGETLDFSLKDEGRFEVNGQVKWSGHKMNRPAYLPVSLRLGTWIVLKRDEDGSIRFWATAFAYGRFQSELRQAEEVQKSIPVSIPETERSEVNGEEAGEVLPAVEVEPAVETVEPEPAEEQEDDDEEPSGYPPEEEALQKVFEDPQMEREMEVSFCEEGSPSGRKGGKNGADRNCRRTRRSMKEYDSSYQEEVEMR